MATTLRSKVLCTLGIANYWRLRSGELKTTTHKNKYRADLIRKFEDKTNKKGPKLLYRVVVYAKNPWFDRE
jgi:hypothetical protein